MSKNSPSSPSAAKKKRRKVSDTELIRLYLDTQREVYFQSLYRRYSTKVYSKCLSMLKEESLASDATQEIFTRIFLKLASFSEKAKFSTWVYSVTFNYCIDFLRKQQRRQKLFSDEEDENLPDPAEEVPDHELLAMEVDRLKVVLEKIPPGDKQILLMKYREELQIREIAEILDKTESAVKMKIKRAKHKAQKVYEEVFKDYL